MSAGQHTPGPWKVSGLGGPWEQRLNIRADEWGCVAQVGLNPSLPSWDAPQRANARLIAAAPDLLEALQAAVGSMEKATGGISRCDWIAGARAAIAKATWATVEEPQPDDQDDDDPECPRCRGDGRDPMNDYLLPCPECQGEQTP
jgi:hypothetical protein